MKMILTTVAAMMTATSSFALDQYDFDAGTRTESFHEVCTMDKPVDYGTSNPMMSDYHECWVNYWWPNVDSGKVHFYNFVRTEEGELLSWPTKLINNARDKAHAIELIKKSIYDAKVSELEDTLAQVKADAENTLITEVSTVRSALNGIIEDKQIQIDDLARQRDNLNARIDLLQADFDAESARATANGQLALDLQDEINAITQAAEDAATLAALDSTAAWDAFYRVQEELVAAQIERDTLQVAVNTAVTERDHFESLHADLADRWNDFIENDHYTLQGDFDALSTTYEEAVAEIAALKQQKVSLQDTIDSKIVELRESELGLAAANLTIITLNNTIEALETTVADNSVAIDALTVARDDALAAMGNLQNELIYSVSDISYYAELTGSAYVDEDEFFDGQDVTNIINDIEALSHDLNDTIDSLEAQIEASGDYAGRVADVAASVRDAFFTGFGIDRITEGSTVADFYNNGTPEFDEALLNDIADTVEEAYRDGYNEGYSNGYNDGWRDATAYIGSVVNAPLN